MGEKQTYDLSHGQKRFWVQSQLDAQSSALNQSVAVRIRQAVNTAYLQQALHTIVERHFILRTVFTVVEGVPKQVVLEQLTLNVPVVDVSDTGEETAWAEVQKEIQTVMNQPFDLEQSPLWRAQIYMLAANDYVFHICMHHIIEDGWSMDLFFQELFHIYQALEQGTSPHLPELPIQYIDYAHWQNQQVLTGKLSSQEQYWKSRLDGELPSLQLPLDFPRPTIRNAPAAVEKVILDAELCAGLERLNRTYGTTMFMSIVASLNVLLARLTQQEDIIIGTPVAGRNQKQVRNLMGFFVNTLVLRNRLSRDISFSRLLQQVKDECAGAYAHQDYPFDKLLQVLNRPRRLNRAPLFDVLINFAAGSKNEENFGGIPMERIKLGNGADANEFDLTVIVESVNDELVISLSYGTDLFTALTMSRIGAYFRNIIAGAIQDPEQSVWKMDYMGAEERAVIHRVNDTQKVYPAGVTITSRIQEQTLRTPDAVGVLDGDMAVTYKELHLRSNQLGQLFSRYGVRPNSLVAIMGDRNVPLLTAILGIMKAGGAYVPIDPDYPQSRIQYMLDDSSCRVLVTNLRYFGRTLDHLPDCIKTVICLDETVWGESEWIVRLREMRGDESYFIPVKAHGMSTDELSLQNIPNEKDLAYIMYTSGSTGQPKGVMMTHKAVLNTLFWLQDTFALGADDVIAQKTSTSFTDSVWEWFWPLMEGAKLTIVPADIVKDPAQLYPFMEREKVTVTQFVPALMNVFLSAVRNAGESHPLPDLKWIFNGGEALPVNIVQEWYTLFRTAKIANLYGMTESAIYATQHIIQHKPDAGTLRIPLGLPIANTHVYVLDQDGQLAGFQVQGEICIGGTGLASGYWAKPDLTARAFTTHPLTGERLYRTGDLGCQTPDGQFQYLGRKDDQVQVRGFRVEMKEVEQALVSLPSIREAAVIAHVEETGLTGLIGYYTLQSPEMTSEGVREHLKERLPDYMVPGLLVPLEAMPLTPHGKIDRKHMPKPEGRSLAGTEYVPPRDGMEQELSTIWAEILDIAQVGVQDPFFALGGHSLKMAKMIYRIQERLQVKVTFKELFDHQTIRELADLLRQKTSVHAASIEPLPEQEYYPVSAAQRRLFVLHQLEGESLSNHVFTAWHLEGSIQREQLERLFRTLLLRHEVFRTGFTLLEDEVVQQIHSDVAWKMEYTEGTAADMPQIQQSFLRPFDLQQPPLLRVMLVRLAEQSHVLLLDVHHIIFDGISATVLIDEFISLMEGSTLEKSHIQYKDFAAWQHTQLSGEHLKEQEAFWLKMFDEQHTGKDIPLLNLPGDYPRPRQRSFAGGSLEFSLSSDCATSLRKLATESGATLFMVLLAAYNVFLSRYSGQEDIVVGTPIAGRSHVQLERMLGMFVNTLTLRNAPVQEKTFRQFLDEVKDNALNAFEHQDYPFDMLVNRLHLQRDLSRNPLFDTMFRLQNFMDGSREVPGLLVKPYPLENSFASFDLMLTVVEMPTEKGASNISRNGLHCTFEYSTELFREHTVRQMAQHFIELVAQLASQPDRPLYAASLLTPAEQSRILVDRNVTELALPADKLMHHLFEEQAARMPDAIAVECGSQCLTYGELDVLSNRVARTLRSKGADVNTVVALLLERSVDLLTAMLGILKAGAAYLPIDPDYPAARISYMLEESEAQWLISRDTLLDGLDFRGEVISLNDESIYRQDGKRLEITQPGPHDLAYMIFTSGSTGHPKGVMIRQEAIVNLIYGITERIPFPEGQTFFSVTTAAFDIFVLETLLPLAKGLRVVLSTGEEQANAELLLEAICRTGPHLLQMTPSRLQLLLMHPEAKESMRTLQVVMVGGEALPEPLLRQTQEMTTARIFNMYGPTETTVWSTVQELTQHERVTVGTPIANTQVYILDGQLQPVADLVAGDLWIGGKGLASGYDKRPELTSEKFKANPFRSGERMFKTGDLARWLPNGEIEVLGRMDDQIKVRGYRVELGEIEQALLAHPAIREAVVVQDRSDEQENHSLCAYWVGQQTLSVSELRNHLLARLPEYMVPSHFITLSEMPLTPNGKVNRRMLPKPDPSRPLLEVEYTVPATEVEMQVSRIWEEVLHRSGLGIHDNFFELGGNSVLLIQMNVRLQQIYPGKISVADCFAYPTIARLSGFLEQQQGEQAWTDAEQERYERQEQYWRLYLAESLSFIPWNKAMRTDGGAEGQATFTFTLPADLLTTLQKAVWSQDFALTDLLLAVYTYVLSQMTGQSELVLLIGEGHPLPHKQFIHHGQSSFLASQLTGESLYPLRVRLTENDDFSALCIEVAGHRQKAKETDLYPIPVMLPNGTGNANPSVFLPCVFLNHTPAGHEVTRQFDWVLHMDVRAEQVRFLCEYQAGKLKKTWAEQMMKAYVHVLRKIADLL
ncbi:non-ribosomal peptide synthetase [Paenibacillus polymyxa]|uniref:non-ribosomal peptide synthetase n=1 Tax=Paenibacillus polymyxa TaxID=1406 RepID=UPI00083DABD2|nr:non-ribosomal peptide synthetase [Paenibacillus polymyxa]ODB56712.1 non-ribosomal peptide synthetase [Paenibacillus polymyxa]